MVRGTAAGARLDGLLGSAGLGLVDPADLGDESGQVLARQHTVDDGRDHASFPAQTRCPGASAGSTTDCARRSGDAMRQPVAQVRISPCAPGHQPLGIAN